ncbi:MAG TPA: dockerin type I domain-containing protein [Saprospiraceae bacterium]|nr:dockerin type I domain-containing protein [Saprospiraceae bacterium]
MALTLIVSAFTFNASGQSYYSYFGENTFRNYGTSGVLNHNYFVYTRIGAGAILNHGPFNTNYLSNCGVYESLIRLNNTSTTMNNELRVRPTCPNTPADYIDGVSTIDLVFIERHILGIQPFTDGYQKIEADVNNNSSITAADVTMLRQLVLGITTSFTRNSWE